MNLHPRSRRFAGPIFLAGALLTGMALSALIGWPLLVALFALHAAIRNPLAAPFRPAPGRGILLAVSLATAAVLAGVVWGLGRFALLAVPAPPIWLGALLVGAGLGLARLAWDPAQVRAERAREIAELNRIETASGGVEQRFDPRWIAFAEAMNRLQLAMLRPGATDAAIEAILDQLERHRDIHHEADQEIADSGIAEPLRLRLLLAARPWVEAEWLEGGLVLFLLAETLIHEPELTGRALGLAEGWHAAGGKLAAGDAEWLEGLSALAGLQDEGPVRVRLNALLARLASGSEAAR